MTFTRELLAVTLLAVPLVGGGSSIHDAITANDLARLREILRTDPAAIRDDSAAGGSPLRLAALLGNVPALELLVSSGARVNSTDNTGETPLHAAVGSSGYPDTRAAILFLLTHGADVNARDTKTGRTPLYTAAAKGLPETVSTLLSHGALVNVADSTKATPLHAVIERGFKSKRAIVELLIAAGADVNAKTLVGYTVLHELALLQVGFTWPTIRSGAGLSPSLAASFRNTVSDALETAEVLLSHGAAVNAREDYDLTPLFFAANTEKPELVELLINEGADVNAKNRFGQTPLQFASSGRSPESVAVLRRHGASH